METLPAYHEAEARTDQTIWEGIKWKLLQLGLTCVDATQTQPGPPSTKSIIQDTSPSNGMETH